MAEIIKVVRVRGKISTDGEWWKEPKPDSLGLNDCKLILHKRKRKDYFVLFETGTQSKGLETVGLSYPFEPKASDERFKTTDDFITEFVETLNLKDVITSQSYSNPITLSAIGFARWYYDPKNHGSGGSASTASSTASIPPFWEIIQDPYEDSIPPVPTGYFDKWNEYVKQRNEPPKPKETPVNNEPVDKTKFFQELKFNVEKEGVFVIVNPNSGPTGASGSGASASLGVRSVVTGDLRLIDGPADWVFNEDELDEEFYEASAEIESEQAFKQYVEVFDGAPVVNVSAQASLRGIDPADPAPDNLRTDKQGKYPVSKNIEANIQEIIKQAKGAGITNAYAIAGILAVCSKESGFVPKNELSYRTTSADRIMQIFGSRGKTAAFWDEIKQDDKRFFDFVYGPTPPKKDRYGNGPTDGYKYRGRGFNQITFKAAYERYAKSTKLDLINDPDLLNKVEAAAACLVEYFKSGINGAPKNIRQQYNFTDINSFKSLDDAVGAMYHSNAGFGNSMSHILADSTGGRAKAFKNAGPLYNQYKSQLG